MGFSFGKHPWAGLGGGCSSGHPGVLACGKWVSFSDTAASCLAGGWGGSVLVWFYF